VQKIHKAESSASQNPSTCIRQIVFKSSHMLRMKERSAVINPPRFFLHFPLLSGQPNSCSHHDGVVIGASPDCQARDVCGWSIAQGVRIEALTLVALVSLDCPLLQPLGLALTMLIFPIGSTLCGIHAAGLLVPKRCVQYPL
jgi:hypothetical protein